MYGKPLPPKSQVRAHLQLLQMIKDEPKEGVKMNNRTLREASIRLGTVNRQVLILENGDHIPFQEFDFDAGGDNSDHVNLFEHGSIFAVVDMRSVTGVKLENA